MAPWNIAFRSGKLIYIDYDTRDNELTKVLPMAYQVCSVSQQPRRRFLPSAIPLSDWGRAGPHAVIG